jgi:mannose-6-phosphate isomerase-like protein (cupin superfamily)
VHALVIEFVAPDGIIIRPIVGARSDLVSVVVGVIPPRDADYAVHTHLALEQVTYVLRGSITAISRGPGNAEPTEFKLGPGEAITTAPRTALSFRNRSQGPAEVLFICVPPYPASDADTELIGDGQVPMTTEQLERAVERHRRAQAYLVAAIEARLQQLRWASTE